jgi:hypothetical protein
LRNELLPGDAAVYIRFALCRAVYFFCSQKKYSVCYCHYPWRSVFFSLPQKVDEMTAMRFTLFAIGLHLLVAFVPFMVRDEMNGLWQFNKYIFIRILTSALYSGVLFIGLALALVAI